MLILVPKVADLFLMIAVIMMKLISSMLIMNNNQEVNKYKQKGLVTTAVIEKRKFYAENISEDVNFQRKEKWDMSNTFIGCWLLMDRMSIFYR